MNIHRSKHLFRAILVQGITVVAWRVFRGIYWVLVVYGGGDVSCSGGEVEGQVVKPPGL